MRKVVMTVCGVLSLMGAVLAEELPFDIELFREPPQTKELTIFLEAVTLTPFDEELVATIQTDDLFFRSVNWDDYSDYMALFSDAETMRYAAEPASWTEEIGAEKLREWIWRWEKGMDPFSALTIFKQGDVPQVIGSLLLDHGQERGQAQLFLFLKQEYWANGSGAQVLGAILQEYATYLAESNYYVNLNDPRVPAAPLKSIHAWSRVDCAVVNEALEGVGMKQVDQEIRQGVYLHHYAVTVDTLEWLEGRNYARQHPEEETLWDGEWDFYLGDDL